MAGVGADDADEEVGGPGGGASKGNLGLRGDGVPDRGEGPGFCGDPQLSGDGAAQHAFVEVDVEVQRPGTLKLGDPTAHGGLVPSGAGGQGGGGGAPIFGQQRGEHLVLLAELHAIAGAFLASRARVFCAGPEADDLLRSQRPGELVPGQGAEGVQQLVGTDPEDPPVSGQPVEQESVAFFRSARLEQAVDLGAA